MSFPFEAELIDESHFGVKIRACDLCGQRFLCVFTECIDWVDGEDPQASTVLPLTPPELACLTSSPSTAEATLNHLGTGRRSLCHDFPKGEAPRTYWSTGILVGPHD